MKTLQRLVKLDLAETPGEPGRLLSAQGFQDPALGPDREALVEPEVLGRRIGDEVAGPAVGELVGHHIDKAAVAREQGRREEGHARIFHTAVRKCRGEHQHVVAVPVVGPEQRLGARDHGFRVGELPGRRGTGRGLGPDSAAVREIASLKLADGEREEIARYRLGHLKLKGVPSGLGRRIARRARAHHGGQARGHGHLRFVADARDRAVLAGQHAARVDGLALAEEKRAALAFGLFGREPLQADGRGARLVGQGHRLRLRGQAQAKATAENGFLGAEFEGDRRTIVSDGAFDGQAFCIEIKRPLCFCLEN